MKRRLRKKLRTGEFRELGFHVRFAFAPEISSEDSDEVHDAFIAEAIEGNELHFGGGGDRVFEGFVTCARGRSSVDEDRREAVRRWLAEHPLVNEVEVGDFVDAWA